MTHGISERFWQTEARTEETKQFIRDIKRTTRRQFSAEEKIRIVLEASGAIHLSETSAEGKVFAPAPTTPG